MFIKGFFHLFSFLLTLSSVFVISLRNSIQSIVSLIVCFIASSILLLILNCEFFAFLFLIVYVGAIAVLFLFALMMLELKHLDNKANPFHMLVGLSVPVMFFLLTSPFIHSCFVLNPYYDVFQQSHWVFINNCFDEFYVEDDVTDIEVLGQLLYTRYALQFLLTGLILTLAVVCVGVLTIDRTKYLITEVNELVVSRIF